MQNSPANMALSPTVLANRIFRIAAVGVATVLFGALAAFVVAEEQCDANGGGPLCTRAPPPAPLVAVAEPSDVGEDLMKPMTTASPSAVSPNSSDDVPATVSINDSVGDAVRGGNASGKVMPAPQLGPVRLGMALCMLLSILAWLLLMVKFACDGSLPARLALWGLLPEAYAAISVRAVYHLLRLKDGATPVIVLRNCVSDENAVTLAEAMDKFGANADLQAVELPHNPQLGATGLQYIMDAAIRTDSKVVELDFSYNPQFGDRAVAALKPALELKKSKISMLKLADCGLTHTGLTQIASAAAKSKLRTLDLSWNSLQGNEELAGTITEAAPVLEELVLTCCDLGPDEVAAVAEQLPYTSIRSLQLGGNRFGSEGLERLCEHLPTSQVDELGLEAVGLEAGCEGLSALAAAWVKRPFSRVRLYGNRMTQEEVATFIRTLKSMQL